MKMHVLVRFGRWREIIDEPLPADPEIYKVSIPMHHYARAIAYATLKDPVAADRERALFREPWPRIPAEPQDSATSRTAPWAWREPCSTARSNTTGATRRRPLPVSARPCTATTVSSTPSRGPGCIRPATRWPRCSWSRGSSPPPRPIYRDDLGLSGRGPRCTQHPDNVWSLHGLVECLQRRGERNELMTVQEKLATALALADVPITSSCMCRTKIGAQEPTRSCH